MLPSESKLIQSKCREISPSPYFDADTWYSMAGPEFQRFVDNIRAAKRNVSRPVPSASLVDRSSLLNPKRRAALLDFVAGLVDENLAGRSEMCVQFASLIERALMQLGFGGEAIAGDAIYFSTSEEEIFRWKHAWVRIGNEVIDANTDTMAENVAVPDGVIAPPYWGPIKEIPFRRLRVGNDPIPEDPDVISEWWPRLSSWLTADFQEIS